MTLTLREATNELSAKLGGYDTGTVAIDPDISDTLAQRSVLTSDLYDTEKQPEVYAGRYMWIGKIRNQRRIRQHGYTTANYVIYTPPDEGTYQLVVYGFGTTRALGAKSPANQILAAIQSLDPDFFDTLEVEGKGPFTIKLPSEPLDMEPTKGTIVATGGIARILVTTGFTQALRHGDTFDIHKVLPVLDADSYTGLHSHIRAAARKIWKKDLYPITPNASGIYTRDSMSWIQYPDQIQAIMGPAEWSYLGTFTPPTSGTFTLTFSLINRNITTEPITAETMDADTIGDAVDAAFALVGVINPFTIVTDSVEPWVTQFTITRSLFASTTISATSGTIVENRAMLTDPSPLSMSPNIMDDLPSYQLIVPGSVDAAASFYIYGLRPVGSWVAPQASWGVVSNAWSDSPNGPLNDYDQFDVNLDDIKIASYYEATKHLAGLGPQAETGYWKQENLWAAQAAAHIAMYDIPFNASRRRGRSSYGGKFGWAPGVI